MPDLSSSLAIFAALPLITALRSVLASVSTTACLNSGSSLGIELKTVDNDVPPASIACTLSDSISANVTPSNCFKAA